MSNFSEYFETYCHIFNKCTMSQFLISSNFYEYFFILLVLTCNKLLCLSVNDTLSIKVKLNTITAIELCHVHKNNICKNQFMKIYNVADTVSQYMFQSYSFSFSFILVPIIPILVDFIYVSQT